jgi:hypothetical protein
VVVVSVTTGPDPDGPDLALRKRRSSLDHFLTDYRPLDPPGSVVSIEAWRKVHPNRAPEPEQ